MSMGVIIIDSFYIGEDKQLIFYLNTFRQMTFPHSNTLHDNTALILYNFSVDHSESLFVESVFLSIHEFRRHLGTKIELTWSLRGQNHEHEKNMRQGRTLTMPYSKHRPNFLHCSANRMLASL
jgi:hypothetical protein